MHSNINTYVITGTNSGTMGISVDAYRAKIGCFVQPGTKKVSCPLTLPTHLHDNSNNLVMSIRVILMLLCIGSAYIPPQYSPFYDGLDESNGVELFESHLLNVLSILPDVHEIIAGDFNARIVVESDVIFDDNPNYVINAQNQYSEDTFPALARVSKDKEINAFGRSLLSMCTTFNMHILNGRAGTDANNGDFTCITNTGASVIDYIIVSTSLFFRLLNFSIALRTDSDHLPLTFEIHSHFENTEREKEMNKTKIAKYIWLSDCQEKFTNIFQTGGNRSGFDRIIDNPSFDVNIFVELVKNVYKSAAAQSGMVKHICLRNTTSQRQPVWFDYECKQLKTEKCRLLGLLRRDENYLREFNDLKKRLKSLCRAKKKQYLESEKIRLLANLADNKLFWSTLRQINCNTSVESLIPNDKWYTYFSNLFVCDDDGDDFHLAVELETLLSTVADILPGTDQDLNNDLLNYPISVNEIELAINSLKTGKASGPDGLISEYFKNTSNYIIPILHVLFNKIWETRNFPEEWSEAINNYSFV